LIFLYNVYKYFHVCDGAFSHAADRGMMERTMASSDLTNPGTAPEKREMDEETLRKLDRALQGWDDNNSEVRRLFEESERRWVEIVQPLVEAIGNSERLSEEDLAVRINTRD
jgi:hypothetical protein